MTNELVSSDVQFWLIHQLISQVLAGWVQAIGSIAASGCAIRLSRSHRSGFALAASKILEEDEEAL